MRKKMRKKSVNSCGYNSFIKRDYNKKAQITVFIILAILIVAVIVLIYFFLKNGNLQSNVPQEFSPAYSYYISCIDDQVKSGIQILGMQGGYIQQPEFFPGSEYMPFSNQLDFLGTGIPYWYYISGNGVAKEQIPSKEKMQSQLNDFLKQRIPECDFSYFEDAGYEITLGNISVDTIINENKVSVDVNQDMIIKFGDDSWKKSSHSFETNSNLGKFYNLAKKIYENNKEKMFLENYGVDILRLNAPVDGSEIGCSPKIWLLSDIRENITRALEVNIPQTKISGDYYTLTNKENKYFVTDIGEKSDIPVNFVYSRNWPLKLEVWPSDGNLLRADPMGLQQGFGMLGFCYVPYHYVYDFSYPVLIQLYSTNEVFQFPIVVLIDKNKPRKAPNVEGLPDVVPELCLNKNNPMSVYTYDKYMNPVEADVEFKCFDTTCDIGRTTSDGKDAILQTNFPQCVNGYIIARAQDYEDTEYIVSSPNENSAILILNKKYNLSLEIEKLGQDNSDYAVVTFSKENGSSTTVAYPEQKQVELTEGQYKIKLYVYTNSSFNLKGSSSQQCVDIPRTGILGVFGATEKKCFTLNIPDQVVSYAVSGGGSQNYFIGESEIENAKKIILTSTDFGIPRSIEELKSNFDKIDTSDLEVRFE